MIGTDLRFLDADKVASPAGQLSGFELCSRDHEMVGTIDGVLIDPPARRVRYLVLKIANQANHCLLPVETSVQMDAVPRIGWIDGARADLDLEPYDLASAREFTADDAITAIFGK